MFDYIRDPQAIYQRSFELVAAATELDGLPESLHTLAQRLVHACAMPDIVADLAWQGDLAAAANRALAAGAPIIADCQMVVAGITRARLPAQNRIICTLHEPEIPELSAQLQTTRSAAAINLWHAHTENAVIAIGNAPTALFRLLELLLQERLARPAVILAFPVGFVGAAESKQALIDADLPIPFLRCVADEGQRAGGGGRERTGCLTIMDALVKHHRHR